MPLGSQSVSLAVKDIAASRAFHEKPGFARFAGQQEQQWLIKRWGRRANVEQLLLRARHRSQVSSGTVAHPSAGGASQTALTAVQKRMPEARISRAAVSVRIQRSRTRSADTYQLLTSSRSATGWKILARCR